MTNMIAKEQKRYKYVFLQHYGECLRILTFVTRNGFGASFDKQATVFACGQVIWSPDAVFMRKIKYLKSGMIVTT